MCSSVIRPDKGLLDVCVLKLVNQVSYDGVLSCCRFGAAVLCCEDGLSMSTQSQHLQAMACNLKHYCCELTWEWKHTWPAMCSNTAASSREWQPLACFCS